MKNRPKFTVSEKYIHGPRTNESDEFHLDLRVKKKISSNPLIQKNIAFLQTYNNLFKKPSHHQIGDADAYFRQSLRSETFDLIRDLNLEAHLVKSVKSFENINKRKVRSKRTVLSPRRLSSKPFKPNGRSVEETQEPLISDKGEPLKQPVEAAKATSSVLEEDFFQELYSPRQVEEAETSESDSESDTETEEKELEADGDLTPKVEQDIVDRLDGILNTVEQDLDNIMEGEEEVADGANFETYLDVPMEEGEDDDIKEVEEMIEQAAEELQQVAEENQNLMQALEGEEEEGGGEDKPATEDSTFKFDPAIDSAILKELDDAERQARETVNVIFELKKRVAELAQKEKMTEEEAKELEAKNKELEQLMILFEEKVKRIQQLIMQSNLFESMMPIQPMLQMRHKEDTLPQVLVCGITEENIPKIIVCDKKNGKPKKAKTPRSPQTTAVCTPRSTCTPRGAVSPSQEPVTSTMIQQMPQHPQMNAFAQKLNECICMQEKLAAENANLEGTRYELQGALINKDQTVESLQRQLFGLQAELRMVCQENCALTQKLQQGGGAAPYGPESSTSPSKQPCGKGRAVCPADIETRLQEYSENTHNLECQLADMENDVRGMQEELTAVQKERAHLEHHRKMMCPPQPCCRSPCLPPPWMSMSPCLPVPCSPPPGTMPPPCNCEEDTGSSADQQIKELREKYNLLQDDFKSKLKEVSTLRAENNNLKDTLEAERENLTVYQDKVRKLEDELKGLLGDKGKGAGLKEQLMEMEQQLNVSKQRFREAQDELEELRLLVQDQQQQMDDYRNKYLEAQQQVEEQRRHIDLMEMENQRVSEQVNLEIQRVKNQFQEKVQELMPLPDILKSTQLKLQEAQQMHLLAERNNEAITRELQMYKDKLQFLTNQLEMAKSNDALGKSEKDTLLQKIADLEQELKDMKEENYNFGTQISDLEDRLATCQLESDNRAHDILQLEANLDNVREESARQVARTKDRCEIVRKSMQNQINDLERQLAQCRAQAKAAQKDRDEVRQKMQTQICNLNENFEDATMRIRSLQGHVNFLKNTYGVVTTDPCPKTSPPDPCNCGADY
ncbi:unnamed protein product [Acanthoscelides obtectus]|uniref:Uncharacterized protein n=1 Tax=Acanthoscelides obtectus TaxID=200917 RepID=A0A9P0MAY7_ACAOB|nr:unnamed protein product [Acanthoscelides obtectus]CAK1678376.1 Outer dense fiber protein 2 [Acanthoscelides obtectus]